MAKFHGVLGYVHTEITAPGVHSEVVTEKPCRGDILRDNRQWEPGDGKNSDINIRNRFSLLGDDYSMENLQHIRYLEWNGTKWLVNGVEIQRPRLILNVGGVWNG